MLKPRSLPRQLLALAGFCIFGSALAMGQSTVSLFKPGAIRALILSGRNNHDWRSTTPYLRKILLASGVFDVRVNEEPDGMTARTLAAYDVIIVDYNGPRWGETAEKAVESFVSSGKGLVAVHGASWAFGDMVILGDHHVPTGMKEPPWPAYWEMIGGKWSDKAPRSGHARRHIFSVKFTDREHPITQGMGESFLANDELYHNLRLRPNIHVLATAYDNPDIGGTGKDEPLLWTVPYGKGRVFYTALGHDLDAMGEPGFIATFARGTQWAATGRVTLPTKIELDPVRKDAVRVLVVTGGHPHDPDFYSLFTGHDDIVATVAPHPESFKSDLRTKYDVIVLYDLIQNLPDEERTNLRNFVESGKGVLVLHHATADFNNWEWWYRDVTGGRYLLKPEDGRPASTYKIDQEMIVQPAMAHPITAGIGPLHIWDEAYKGMEILPSVKPLLKTDNPNTDGTVAWISPYEKSRVVCIALGHDQRVHRYPGYRKLIHNAILWSAGRLAGPQK